MMNNTICKLCGFETRPHVQLPNEQWVRFCPICGLGETIPFVCEADYESEYFNSPRYYADYQKNDKPAKYDVGRYWVRKWNEYQGKGLVLEDVQDKTALEFGCAFGYGLEVLQNFGFRVLGVEISEYARERAQVTMVSSVEGLVLEEPIDLLIFWDSLEHPDDPFKVMQELVHYMKTGSVVLMHAPDAYPQRPKEWRHWAIGDHKWHFNRPSIDVLFGKYSIKLEQFLIGAKDSTYQGDKDSFIACGVKQ